MWRIRSESAADFWVCGGLRWSPQQVRSSPREKYTRRIRQRSAGSLRGYEQIHGGTEADLSPPI